MIIIKKRGIYKKIQNFFHSLPVVLFSKEVVFHENTGNHSWYCNASRDTCNGKLHICNILNHGKGAEYNPRYVDPSLK